MTTLCIAGKNEIAVRGLEIAISKLGVDRVIVCPNRTDDGVSRWQPSLRRFAREWGVPIVALDDLYARPDLLFVSLEFDQIVNTERFSTSQIFNIHFSKLPAYKGMYTSAWPILNGEEQSGVTLHRIDNGVDTGNVIDQVTIPILQDFTARDLYFEYMKAGIGLFESRLDDLLSGHFSEVPQSALGSSYYSKSSINYNKLFIDTRNTAEFLTRQARAFHFREFQVPLLGGVSIWNGRIENARSKSAPGTIRADGDDAIVVSTIDFDVHFQLDMSDRFFQLVERSEPASIMRHPRDEQLINMTDYQGMTPLMLACRKGNRDVVDALVHAGADVDKADVEGATALRFACVYGIETGDFGVCCSLLDEGADPTRKDRFGRSIKDWARASDHRSVLRFLGEITCD